MNVTIAISDQHNVRDANQSSIVQDANRFLLSEFSYNYLNGSIFRGDNYDRARKEKPVNKFHPEGIDMVYILV